MSRPANEASPGITVRLKTVKDSNPMLSLERQIVYIVLLAIRVPLHVIDYMSAGLANVSSFYCIFTQS